MENALGYFKKIIFPIAKPKYAKFFFFHLYKVGFLCGKYGSYFRPGPLRNAHFQASLYLASSSSALSPKCSYQCRTYWLLLHLSWSWLRFSVFGYDSPYSPIFPDSKVFIVTLVLWWVEENLLISHFFQFFLFFIIVRMEVATSKLLHVRSVSPLRVT